MSNLSKSDRREVRKQAAKQRQQMKNLMWVGIAAILIVLAFILPPIIEANAPVGTINPPVTHEFIETDGNTAGLADAPVEVAVYSDFQCPACLNAWSDIEPLLIEQYINTGKIRFTYRTAGDWLGAESYLASEAAYCAEDQGMFWEFVDIVFSNFSNGNSGGYREARLVAMAGELGMDESLFSDCLANGDGQARVDADREAFEALHVDNTGSYGTPSFSINGELLTFDTWDDFFTAIDASVAAAGN